MYISATNFVLELVRFYPCEISLTAASCFTFHFFLAGNQIVGFQHNHCTDELLIEYGLHFFILLHWLNDNQNLRAICWRFVWVYVVQVSRSVANISAVHYCQRTSASMFSRIGNRWSRLRVICKGTQYYVMQNYVTEDHFISDDENSRQFLFDVEEFHRIKLVR